jgi:hypothetical protein
MVTFRGWDQKWLHMVGRGDRGDKRNHFWQKHSLNCDFYGSTHFLSFNDLTGGSGVRGKAGLNWVRNVFQIIQLYSIYIFYI